MTVASTPNTSILLRMRSSRSARSSRATACSQDVAIALEAGLVAGWAAASRAPAAVDPAAYGGLGAVVTPVIQYRAAVHREPRVFCACAPPRPQGPWPRGF